MIRAARGAPARGQHAATLARAVFATLVLASVAALFYAQVLKREAPLLLPPAVRPVRVPTYTALKATGFTDPDRARQNLRRVLEGRPLVPYPATAARAIARLFPVLLDALASGGKAAVARALPQALIEQTTACGTPDEVREPVAIEAMSGSLPLGSPTWKASNSPPRNPPLFGQRPARIEICRGISVKPTGSS